MPEPRPVGVALDAAEHDDELRRVLKARFRELDANRDGMLSQAELGALLRRGRPDMSDREVRALFLAVDRDCVGRIPFEKFVEFLFAPPSGDQLIGDSKTPVFTPSVKNLLEKASKASAPQSLRSINLCGGTFCEEFNGIFGLDGEVNGHPAFKRGQPQSHIFYGWTGGRRRVGWFLASELPFKNGPVGEYELFNPSPFAATPDLCCASWETCGGNRDKRCFCEAFRRGDGEENAEVTAEGAGTSATAPGWLEAELSKPFEAAEAAPWDEDEEEGWDEQPGEDIEDLEGELGHTFAFDWAASPTASLSLVGPEGGEASWSLTTVANEPPGAVSGAIAAEVPFCDEDFPPSEEALGYSMGFHDFDRSDCFADGWIRAPELHPKPCLFQAIEADDVFGSAKTDTAWFLSACAAVAEYPAWIQSMFGQTTELVPSGRYSVRFFHPGRRAFLRVTIDDHVPTKLKAPVFAGLSADGEIWPQLVEKAFAKFCGSYASMAGGTIAYGLHYLCGGKVAESWKQFAHGRWQRHSTLWRGRMAEDAIPGVGERGDLADRKTSEGELMPEMRQCTSDQLWGQLLQFSDRCYPVACSIFGSRPHAGLLADRAYALVAVREVPLSDGKALRMLYLRNPFGIGEWSGRWSDHSEAWSQCPEVRAALAFQPSRDGAFWISYRDFLRNFETIDVVRKSMPAQGAHRLKLLDLRDSFGQEAA
eukprot:TRINITY_DN12234_c0_g1_i1.p1 TRINITY_DN12234_c0_g1~~TRINITY_DN12234_c0_g1_i1.p1  ORF type:complete len:706 (+),score=156.99 TRINITY_DN12234_c0_g1_i1:72-2189(+)